jgi:hypothetical protein
MTNDTTYNGWANYETWNVTHWIDKDEGLYGFVRDGLENLLEEHGNDWENISLTELKELIVDSFNACVAGYGGRATPDGVRLFDPKIDWSEVSDMLLELAKGNNLQVRAQAN